MADWIEHLERGYEALRSGSSQVAGVHFMAAWELEPEDPVSCYAYARSLTKAENWVEAEPLLKRAFELDPHLVDAACEWVRVKIILGADYDLAFALLVQLERAHPAEYLIPLTKIELLLRSGDDVRCRSELEAARRRGAPVEHLLVAQAKIEQLVGLKEAQEGNLKEAEERFSQAASLDTAWAAPYINRGVVLEKLGDVDGAQKCYLRALEIEAENPVALYNLSLLLFGRDELPLASTYVRRLLVSEADYPGAQELAAAILERVS